MLELSREGSLFDRLKIEKKFSEKLTAKFMRDILEAMDYLHNQTPPIIHRDLKPENLLIFQNDKIKVTDFGWSAHNVDVRNTFCGTQEYLAPEMINGTGHNEKLDIWTLGVLMYEMLHGRTPFYVVGTKIDIRKQKKMIEERILSNSYEFAPELSSKAVSIIKAMLHPDSNHRPSAKQLLNFEFFAIVNGSMKRNPSNTIIKNASIEELERLQLEIAKLKSINEKITKDNKNMNNIIKSSKNEKIFVELENKNKELQTKEKEIQKIKQDNNTMSEDIRNLQREFDTLNYKYTINENEKNKLNEELKKQRNLSSYLFKSSKV